MSDPIKLEIHFNVPKDYLSKDPRQVRKNLDRVIQEAAAKAADAAMELYRQRRAEESRQQATTLTIAAAPPAGRPTPIDPTVEPWKPLQRAYLDVTTAMQASARWGVPMDEILRDEVWKNDLYTVIIRRDFQGAEGWPPVTHLSIRREDRGAVRDWRHLQYIKNQLLGPECEAVELFPAESRLVDSANQFHLWGFQEAGVAFPFGYANREVADVQQDGELHVQRPFLDGERPNDTKPGVNDGPYEVPAYVPSGPIGPSSGPAYCPHHPFQILEGDYCRACERAEFRTDPLADVLEDRNVPEGL